MATTVNISAYSGSVSAGDWSPALTAALEAIKTTGGVVNIDTDIELKSQVSFAVSGYTEYVPFNIISDGGSKITINAAGAIPIYAAANLTKVKFSGINFIGNAESQVGQPTYLTGTRGVYCTGVQEFLFENCLFAGVASSVGAVIETASVGGGTPLVIRDTLISGCGATTAMVSVEGTEALMMENVELYDYQNFRGVYYNKQGYAPYWIKAVYSGTPTTSHVPCVNLKNVRTDEGTNFCYIEGYPRVIIDQCSANLNGVTGQGIYLKNVAHAIITQFWAGYSSTGRPSIVLDNCGYVEIDGVQVQNGAHPVQVATSNNMELRASNVTISRP